MSNSEPPRQKCVLIVDDDQIVRRVLAEMLKTQGYDIIEASNGKQAMAAFRTHAIDLMMTDLVMPEQEGIETIKKLRREHPEVKIIAMSGAFGGEYLAIAGLLGAHSTLPKPLRLEMVVETVRKALE